MKYFLILIVSLSLVGCTFEIEDDGEKFRFEHDPEWFFEWNRDHQLDEKWA